MAAPNIVNVSTIYGKTVGAALTTGGVDIVTNSAGSGKVYKVNALYVANVDGTNDATVTMAVYDASADATYHLAYTINVPADSTLDIISNSIYLEEGDKITGTASADGDLQAVLSFEDIS